MSDDKKLVNDLINNMIPQSPKDEIVMIVDCSTSMRSIQTEAQDGINQFIKEQQEVDGGANFTLVEFDNHSKVIHERIDINSVPGYELEPRGMTALCDAIGSACAAVENTDGKIIIVIVTDGDENASQELNAADVKTLITEKQEAGWEFIFLAANQDAIATGANYGIAQDTSINYDANAQGATFAYNAASTYTRSLRTKSKAEAVVDLQTTVDDYINTKVDD